MLKTSNFTLIIFLNVFSLFHIVNSENNNNIVVINKGEKEISTPRQFLEHFGFYPDYETCLKISLDECLCHCDIEKELERNNIPFKTDCGDIYVGMLDDVSIENE